MYTDTHCHISISDYEVVEDVINRAQSKGVMKMIVNGTDLESNKEALSLSKKYSCVFPAIGFHPECIDHFSSDDLKIIEENIDSIVAIGEIGLDYHYEPVDREKQKNLFISQLELAQKYNKPVIVHSRDATLDTIEILKQFPSVKGSIHCFTGSLETAQIYIKMGYKIGIGGVVTFKNANLKKILPSIPKESILLETDSPYLAPEPVRGTKNEPSNIPYIAGFVAETLNIREEELSIITEKNVSDLFDI